MKFMPSKLFHAVVVTGAALTACASPDDGTDQGSTDETAAVADTQADGVADPADPAVDASVETASGGGGTCPPGSERPYPPCFWIL
ncbi:MAG TPA: hypothetical protein VFS00_27535 [Polyangiaceae bacterium]|nr:hypothetical protein [Polyangiaceae bacterium]